ncbi:MAG: hypothetical protein L7U87_08115 [Chlamydiales bacterium]|nr:hypothetical protein [Chlamydiales bacterium]
MMKVHNSSAAEAATQISSPSSTELNLLFDSLVSFLPLSSQAEHAEAILSVIQQLKDNGGLCIKEGPDSEVRPAMVGLQCLFEECFLHHSNHYESADFVIHTTQPSTPCCKLPSESARESLLSDFPDAARLATIDGRSASLDGIANSLNASLHIVYTSAGYSSRTPQQQSTYDSYWKSRVHDYCIESDEPFSAEINGASYRLVTKSGEALTFGIQATQANNADDKCMIIHLGTVNQKAVGDWLSNLTEKLQERGYSLFNA